MALRIWLPLDGSLENKGISNYTITSSDSSVVTNGKIGSCMKIISTTSMGYTPDFNNNSLSLGGWFKFNLAEIKAKVDTLTYSSSATSPTGNLLGNTSYGGIGLVWVGNNHYSSGTFSSMSVFATLRTGSVNQSTSSIAIEFDKWIHIMLTWNPNTHILSLYKDGTLVNSKTFSEFTNGVSRVLSLNYNAVYGGNGPAASIPIYCNDVRIYDHCLSAAEVKEIAQGLVLHYKLDQPIGLTDIVQNPTTYNVYNNYSSSGTTGTLTNLLETYNGSIIRREVMTPNDTSINNFKSALSSHGVYGHRQTFLANTKYVFWIYYRPISHMDVRVGGTASNIGGWTEIPPVSMGNGWYRVGQYRNGTVTSDKTDNIFTSFYTPTAVSGSPITIDWASPHLLQGTTEIPNDDSFMGNDKIIDSSGYGHNGTINGTLTLSNDTPRYSASTNFASGAYIEHKAPENMYYATYSFWVKASSYTNYGAIYIQKNNPNGGASPWLSINTESYKTWAYFGDNSPNYTRGASGSVTTNVWHHYAYVWNNGVAQWYLDGVTCGNTVTYTGKTYIANTSNSTLGDSYTGSSWGGTPFTGQISDFRIYCTALPADDILALYHTGAKVDNLGNLHTFEATETQSNIIFKIDSARGAKVFQNGLSSYTQANCQVTLTDNGYRIYRPPNLSNQANGGSNNMWGGLRLVNQTTDTVAAYDANRDNNWNLQQGHTYLFAFHAKGQSSNGTTFSWTNNMGWGGGGVSPSPTQLVNDGIPTDFQGEKDCIYIFTIGDTITKNCTSAYSSYSAGTTYLSYRHLTFGWNYTNTGTLGTDIYLTNFRLYDITNITGEIKKNGQASFSDFVENNSIARILRNAEFLTNNLIEL